MPRLTKKVKENRDRKTASKKTVGIRKKKHPGAAWTIMFLPPIKTEN